jgi:hypothetical protein
MSGIIEHCGAFRQIYRGRHVGHGAKHTMNSGDALRHELAQRRRRGCLGCLIQPALALLGGGALLYLICILLAPWNFYFGGHFHPVPGWTGRGWMHSSDVGGDYFLFVRFEPTVPGYRKSPISGNGFLCSPKGEKFRLRFGGSMPRNHGTDLRGVPIHLYFYGWTGLQLAADRRPRFDLFGSFGDSELTMDDHGSLAIAFRPDGTLYGPRDHRSGKPENSHVTLSEDSSWVPSTACPAIPK